MTKDEIKEQLFSERANVFAILDGASVDGLRRKLYDTGPPYYCLFRGELSPDVEEVAPYLVGMVPEAPFTEWVLENSFGRHWGVFAISKNSLTEMRKHFRALLTVHDESGKPMLFRYYDPRVLRAFLPTCNGGELKTFFGKVDAFFAEQDDESMTAYRLDKGELKQTDLK